MEVSDAPPARSRSAGHQFKGGTGTSSRVVECGGDEHAAGVLVQANLGARHYAAVVQTTEEAVLNALVANEEMAGYRGRRVPALPRERVEELFRERGGSAV